MKSAYEIAMEKLRRKDAAEGVEDRPLDDVRKTEIAEIRKVYRARLAEREILHRSDTRKARETGDPEKVRELEASYARDRVAIEAEMESKVEAVRRRRP